MNIGISRRNLMQTAGIAAFASPASAAGDMPAPRFEGKDTPKIALSIGDGRGGAGAAQGAQQVAPQGGAPVGMPPGPQGNPPVDPARRIKQLGVDWVLSGGGPIPWDEARLKEQMDRLKASGLNLGNLMIRGLQQRHLWTAGTR